MTESMSSPLTFLFTIVYRPHSKNTKVDLSDTGKSDLFLPIHRFRAGSRAYYVSLNPGLWKPWPGRSSKNSLKLCHIMFLPTAPLSIPMIPMPPGQTDHLGTRYSCHWASWKQAHLPTTQKKILVARHVNRYQPLHHLLLSVCTI